jgi:hypothetical protein
VDEWIRMRNNLPYEEVSAVESTNVDITFNRIAQKLLKKAVEESQLN